MLHDMKNSSRVRVKQFRQIAVRRFFTFVKLANLSNFVIRKFSKSSSPTVLCHRVFAIVKFRAEKQMIRTDARWIIATMENLHSIRNLTVVEKPRNAMRGHHPARIAHPEMTVTIREFCSSPKPTRFRFLNFTPKPFLEAVSHAGAF
jgi:hypothetical protein